MRNSCWRARLLPRVLPSAIRRRSLSLSPSADGATRTRPFSARPRHRELRCRRRSPLHRSRASRGPREGRPPAAQAREPRNRAGQVDPGAPPPVGPGWRDDALSSLPHRVTRYRNRSPVSRLYCRLLEPGRPRRPRYYVAQREGVPRTRCDRELVRRQREIGMRRLAPTTQLSWTSVPRLRRAGSAASAIWVAS